MTSTLPLREHKEDNRFEEHHEHDENNHNEDIDVDMVVVEMRFLVASSQVGSIIGKGGANVKKVREESECSVSILPNDNRSAGTERIMLLKGTPSQIAHAAQLLADLLISGARERGSSTSNGQSDSTSTTVRLLVHRAAIGAIIGKAGVVIRETQELTHARIQIANEALPGSTEKTVSVTGTSQSIHDAMLRMVSQLAANPLKPGTKSYPYNPGNFAPSFQALPFTAQGVMPIYPPSLSAANAPAMTSTQKIAIPTVCAGCVIGKGGSVIRDLRVQSGTNISIADPEANNPNERVVTLTGTPQGIHTAVLLIRQLVEQYQPPERYQEHERY